jgi:hypothetical protein
MSVNYICQESIWLRRKLLYNILTELRITVKLAKIIKVRSNETYG